MNEKTNILFVTKVPPNKVSSIISPFNWYLLRNIFLITVSFDSNDVTSEYLFLQVQPWLLWKDLVLYFFKAEKGNSNLKSYWKAVIFINSASLSLLFQLYTLELFNFKMIPLFNIKWIHIIHTYHRRVGSSFLGLFSVLCSWPIYISLKEITRLSMEKNKSL